MDPCREKGKVMNKPQTGRFQALMEEDEDSEGDEHELETRMTVYFVRQGEY